MVPPLGRVHPYLLLWTLQSHCHWAGPAQESRKSRARWQSLPGHREPEVHASAPHFQTSASCPQPYSHVLHVPPYLMAWAMPTHSGPLPVLTPTFLPGLSDEPL